MWVGYGEEGRGREEGKEEGKGSGEEGRGEGGGEGGGEREWGGGGVGVATVIHKVVVWYSLVPQIFIVLQAIKI